MADDVTLPGTGAVIAADEVGGKKHQRVKLSVGADGSAADMDATNPVYVAAATDGGLASQTTLAAILAKIIAAPATEAKQDTIITALSTLAGYVDGIESALSTLNGKDFATQTTLAVIAGYLDGVETLIAATNSALAAATPAGENFLGSVGGKTVVFDVTFSMDTSAYSSGDVIADSQVMTNALRVNDGTGVLQSLTLIDKDDQGVAFDVYVLDANVAIGTENSAPNISDTNAASILGIIPVATTDWKDLGGAKVAHLSGLSIPIKSVSGNRNLYVGIVNGSGTPTFTASGIVGRFGILQD